MIGPQVTSKVCSCCKLDKPASQFGADNREWVGLQSYCRECAARRKRELRARRAPPPERSPDRIDPRDHLYAAKVASALWDRPVTPEEIRLECLLGRKPIAGTRTNGATGGTDAAGAGTKARAGG